MNEYIRIFSADISGTSLKGYLEMSFKDLEKAFGEPDDGDGEKTSCEWVFRHREQSFTIYDYKVTNVYHPDFLTVEQFRNLPTYRFHIGGNADASDFVVWVRSQLKSGPYQPLKLD